MKVNVFGLGYVGTVSAACLANEGHDVQGVDVEPAKVGMITSGLSPIVEPGLQELIASGIQSGRLSASLTISRKPDVSVVCVGTPSNENGSLQLQYVRRVTEQIAESLKDGDGYEVVVYRSTMLPGTITETVIPILEKISGRKAGQDYGVCMVPEFLREGTSLHDYYNPPYTVVGEIDRRSGDIASALFNNIKAPLHRTQLGVAEMVKYSSNIFHALKVCFANEIGNVCKASGIDSHMVMGIFCEDTKLNLSPYYLKPGFAFGGSCLPKDLRALQYKARVTDVEIPVISSILESNRKQVDTACHMVMKLGKKKIGMLGLSFKPGTDDLRESPMVELAERLLGKGYKLAIYDREVNLAKLFGANKKYIEQIIPHLSTLMHDRIQGVVDNAEVLIVTKNSDEYREVVRGSRLPVVDLVNIGREDIANYHGIAW